MFKKNWYLFTPLIPVAAVALAFAYYTGVFGYSTTEAWQSMRYFFMSGTRYPQKYANDRFDLVRSGLDGRQVFELVGVPFERHDDDAVWIYSGPQDLNRPYYHERKVVFARDAKGTPRVKAVVKEFHVPAAGN